MDFGNVSIFSRRGQACQLFLLHVLLSTAIVQAVMARTPAPTFYASLFRVNDLKTVSLRNLRPIVVGLLCD